MRPLLPRPESGLKEYLTSWSCPHPAPGGGGQPGPHSQVKFSGAPLGGPRWAGRGAGLPWGLGLELLGVSGDRVAAGRQEVALRDVRETSGRPRGQGAPLGPPGEQPLGPQPRAQSPLGGDCGHDIWCPQVFTGPESGVWGPVGKEGQGNQRLLGLGVDDPSSGERLAPSLGKAGVHCVGLLDMWAAQVKEASLPGSCRESQGAGPEAG